MADTGCRGSTTPAAMPAYNAFSTSVPTNFVTRRLQQHVVSTEILRLHTVPAVFFFDGSRNRYIA